MSIVVMFRWRVLPERQDAFTRDWELVRLRSKGKQGSSVLKCDEFDLLLLIQFESKRKGMDWLAREGWVRFRMKWGPLRLTGPEWLSSAVESNGGAIAKVLPIASGPTVDEIQRATAAQLRVSYGKLKSGFQRRDISLARHVAMWLSEKVVHMNPSEIATEFNCDRKSVYYGLKRIKSLLAKENTLRVQGRGKSSKGGRLSDVVDKIQDKLSQRQS